MPRPVTPVGILAALAGGLETYTSRCTTPESPALAALAEATAAHRWEGTLEEEMLSGHVEGQFLKFLVRLVGARRVLEVGMFTGYSALAMAEALPDGGELVACEVDAEVAAFAQPHLPPCVDVRVGPALDTLAQLDGAFDLIFVDADKPSYGAYYELILDRGLLAADGVLAVDNTLMQGQPWVGERTANGEAIAAFNEAVAADVRVEQVLLPLRDGLTLIRRT